MRQFLTGRQNSKRTNLIIKNVTASFIMKGWSALIVLLMVPLTLKMLGLYNNGVWLTISSILIWINFLDVGLGNGLRNAVATYVASNESNKVRQAVASTFFMLLVIIIPMMLITFIVVHFLNLHDLLGIDPSIVPNLNQVIVVAIVLTMSSFILKFVGNFYMGLQLPAANDFFVCMGQTLSLLMTLTAYLLNSQSLFVVVAINTAAPLIVWAISIPYTFVIKYPQYRPKRQDISIMMARSLFSVGLQFFLIQICSIILFCSTNIIISRMLSPEDVTPYQVAYRYFHLVFVIFSTICMPFWNASTDAYTRGDMQWMHNSGKKLDMLLVGVALSLTIMVILSNLVYALWVGSDVIITKDLSIATATYIFIITCSQRYSFILNGLNILRIQIVFTTIATIAFVPLAIAVCKTYQTVTSLVWVMCIVNTPGLFANMWKYYKILNRSN